MESEIIPFDILNANNTLFEELKYLESLTCKILKVPNLINDFVKKNKKNKKKKKKTSPPKKSLHFSVPFSEKITTENSSVEVVSSQIPLSYTKGPMYYVNSQYL